MSGRPPIAKQETDSYLSYYQSPLADVGPFNPPDVTNLQTTSHTTRSGRGREFSLSSHSDSSSDYSSPGSTSRDLPSVGDGQVRRRPSKSSKASGDRRRLAIVETEPAHSSGSGSHRDSRYKSSKKSMQKSSSHFALVAPPDAAPTTYQDLTPPPSSTIPSQKYTRTNDDNTRKHNRSATAHVAESDYEFRKEVRRRSSQQALPKITYPAQDITRSLTPASQASSTSGKSSYFIDVRRSKDKQPLPTPEIGESKPIGASVAAPVVTNVEFTNYGQGSHEAIPMRPSSSTSSSHSPVPSPLFTPNRPEDYLHYQPGIHARAGPLPAPPSSTGAASFFAPSPSSRHSTLKSTTNRDFDTVKQSLQLPQNVTAKLKHRLSSSEIASSSEAEDSVQALPMSPRSSHSREGAFPPSRIIGTTPTSQSPPYVTGLPRRDSLSIASGQSALAPPGLPTSSAFMSSMEHLLADATNACEALSPPADSGSPAFQPHSPPTETNARLSLQRVGSHVSAGSDAHSSYGHSIPPSRPSLSPSHTGRAIAQETPSPPPKSNVSSPAKGHRALPSIPFINSDIVSPELPIAYPPRRPLPARAKIKSSSPDAMFFADVLAKRTALERSMGYVKKINDLYRYDCGLGDWMRYARFTDRVSQTSPRRFAPQPRHTSRSSAMSEVSFPRRPDASTATDLSRVPSGSDTDTTKPPVVLPYPSLAQHLPTPPANHPPPRVLSPTSPIANRSMSFFASLGRKGSSRKAEKAGILSTVSSGSSSPLASSPRVLTKSPSLVKSPPPKPTTTLPPASVPGGPRAIPGKRMARSQTVIISSPFSSSVSNDSSSIRSDSIGAARRPSLFVAPTRPKDSDISQSSSAAVPDHLRRDPEFNKQVDKLADLLPQADKRVLAGYLFRAGQDILAIGQYLEDEQRGTIVR